MLIEFQTKGREKIVGTMAIRLPSIKLVLSSIFVVLSFFSPIAPQRYAHLGIQFTPDRWARSGGRLLG